MSVDSCSAWCDLWWIVCSWHMKKVFGQKWKFDGCLAHSELKNDNLKIVPKHPHVHSQSPVTRCCPARFFSLIFSLVLFILCWCGALGVEEKGREDGGVFLSLCSISRTSCGWAFPGEKAHPGNFQDFCHSPNLSQQHGVLLPSKTTSKHHPTSTQTGSYLSICPLLGNSNHKPCECKCRVSVSDL